MVQKIQPSMTQSGLPPQYLVGLETSRDPVVPTKRIVVSPGSCRSQLDDTDIELTAGIMKRLDQNWAAGSGNGALDQGSLAASTWYHLHVMQNPTTGAVDVLASGSLTNPAYPAGWEAAPRRRVWSVLTDASADIIPYRAAYAQNYRDICAADSQLTLIDLAPGWVGATTTDIPDGVHPTKAAVSARSVPMMIAGLRPLIS